MLYPGRVTVLVVFAAVSLIFLYCSMRAKKTGKIPHIRHIAGLDALEEGVGRATEQGRPVLWTPGIALTARLYSIQAPALMASINILQHLAEMCAEKNTKLIAAVNAPEMLPLVEEVIKLAYVRAGRPEQFKAENIHFFPEQAYTVGVVGLMQREQISTGIYAGSIVHDAIILAETGNAIGAFQVAASSQIGNLPFLVACCDYTLIGEEMLASGAYLSKDPLKLGGILGEDIGKMLALAIAVASIVLLNIGFTRVLDILKL